MNTFRWDGSYLGQHPKSIVIATSKPHRYRFSQLMIDRSTTYVIMKESKTIIPCIIDELKPLFGLTKLGTHSIHIGGRLYVLVHVISDEKGLPIEDPKLSEVKLPDPVPSEWIQEIRKIFCFRQLIGLKYTPSCTIIVRTKNDLLSFISIWEADFDFQKNGPSVSKYVTKKWFGETSILSVIDEMIGYSSGRFDIIPDPNIIQTGIVRNEVLRTPQLMLTTHQPVSEIVSYFRKEIEKIIMRIDKDNILIASLIIGRLMSYLIQLTE